MFIFLIDISKRTSSSWISFFSLWYAVHTVYFWPKMSKSEEGSSRAVISQPRWQLLSKARNVFLAARSLMFPKRNRHPYPKSPDGRSNKSTMQVQRSSLWLSWCDSGIRGWLTVAAAHKVVLAALSPQRRTLTHFLRGWVAPVIRKVKVLCYRLTCYYCQIWFAETEKLLPKWYLKSSSCCPFILAKNRQCARPGWNRVRIC